MSSKKIKRELDCVLSHEELGELGIKSAEHHHKAKLLREEAATIEKAAKEMDQQVSTKRIKREVACIEVKDFAQNAVRVERTDESKYWPEGTPIIEERPMTGEERQTMIDVGDGAGKSGAAAAAPKTTTKAPAKRSAKNKPN